MSDRTPAERLDRALDTLLADRQATDHAVQPAERELAQLLATADRLRLALGPVPVSPRFEARLASRVSRRPRPLVPDVELPTWLVVTGVSSAAAVGVGVTAFAVWRGSRRNGRRQRAG